jgi:hypothetical protein
MLESRRTDDTATDDTATLEATGHQEKTRRCLCCSEDFHSAWAGERVCKKCRSSARWRQGYE